MLALLAASAHLLPQNPPDLVRQDFFALQDLLILSRSLVQQGLGLQQQIFLLLGSVTYALLAVFVMPDLPLLCVAPQVHFAIFQAPPDLCNVLNALVASVVA